MALSKIDPAGLDIGQIGGRRNLIINGAQTVDQRFGGSSELKGSGAKYHTDRFVIYSQAASKITAQQVSEAPAGFKNSLQLTVTNAVTLGATDQYMLQQRIEGQNVSHLAFGTANAETVTLSFYVRSSITGTHSGVLVNGSENRNYPFTYTINAANTWERVSVTITGDTTGTWATTNAVGMWVKWNLGTGSTYLGTAGAWSGSSYLSGATSSVQLIETASATFYITGVQLEVGSVSTPYEHRSFGEELALCQRYYEKSYNAETAPGSSDATGMVRTSISAIADGSSKTYIPFKVAKRAAPAMTAYRDGGATGNWYYLRNGQSTESAVTFAHTGTQGTNAGPNLGSAWATANTYGHWTADAEL